MLAQNLRWGPVDHLSFKYMQLLMGHLKSDGPFNKHLRAKLMIYLNSLYTLTEKNCEQFSRTASEYSVTVL